MITRDDYIKLADILRTALAQSRIYTNWNESQAYRAGVNRVIRDTSKYLEQSNPTFDKERFLSKAIEGVY